MAKGAPKGAAKGKGSAKGSPKGASTASKIPPVHKHTLKQSAGKGAAGGRSSNSRSDGSDQIQVVAKLVEALTDKGLLGQLGSILGKASNNKDSWDDSRGHSKGGKGKSKGKGKGKGKGKAKGSGGSGDKVLTGQVEADFQVKENVSYTGVVTGYNKFKGFGFVKLDKKKVIPDDTAFVHWPVIVSDDRFPYLLPEMKVKFNIAKEEKRGTDKHTIVATNVTLPDGGSINLQEECDDKKEFVGGDKQLRYTGRLKFFSPKNQFGYITIDEGFDYQGDDVPKEIRVETSEVVAVDGKAGRYTDLDVEFGIWKTRKGQFKAFSMTLPGGDPLPAAEKRDETMDE